MNKAEKKAREVLQQHNVTKAPISLDSIVKSFGIRVVAKPYDATGYHDVSGMLYRTANETVVGLNENHSDTRRRFSLAHELGHFLLHKGEVFVDAKVNFRNRLSSMGVDREEIEANEFAAELLMPSNLVSAEFYKLFNANKIFEHTSPVTNLAASFKVSPEAMEFRLKNLGLLQIE